MADNLIWIDLEMSGLDPEKHVILEIAAIVTNGNLDIIAEGPNIVIHHPSQALSTIEEWSKTHHESSGLLDKVKRSPYNCRKAEGKTLEFLHRYSKKGESPLCGNSIWQDRRFLSRYMPSLNTFFHYRNVDVSTVKELVKRWYPALAKVKKRKDHLALSDIKESIEELKFYRRNIFLPAK
ncbi:MAG: oligoribonuclease [Deltaproteobacteria bacterium]|nr:oligoribonuclease [Deltaproteobacteria bacterium]MBW2317137.1 oligoribonuclease [Deltaproteobacteria bacterium]